MSKRLKRRILEICNIQNLSRKEKAKRAAEILFDSAQKQKICNEIIGVSYKDIEKALKDMASLRVPEELSEENELMAICPEKLNPGAKPTRQNKPIKLIPILDPKEVLNLINATHEPIKDKVKTPKKRNVSSPHESDADIDDDYSDDI